MNLSIQCGHRHTTTNPISVTRQFSGWGWWRNVVHRWTSDRTPSLDSSPRSAVRSEAAAKVATTRFWILRSGAAHHKVMVKEVINRAQALSHLRQNGHSIGLAKSAC